MGMLVFKTEIQHDQAHLDPPLAAVPRDGVADRGRCDRRDERRLPGQDGEYRGHVDIADL